MVLTGPQTTAFFTDPAQMALLARTHTQLLTEGIATVDDLSEFNKDDFKQIVDNLKSPPATLNAAVPPV